MQIASHKSHLAENDYLEELEGLVKRTLENPGEEKNSLNPDEYEFSRESARSSLIIDYKLLESTFFQDFNNWKFIKFMYQNY